MSVIITRNIPKVRANFQRGQSVTTGWLMQERLDRARPLGQVCQLGFLPPVLHRQRGVSFSLQVGSPSAENGICHYTKQQWKREFEITLICLTSRTSSVSPAPAGQNRRGQHRLHAGLPLCWYMSFIETAPHCTHNTSKVWQLQNSFWLAEPCQKTIFEIIVDIFIEGRLS